jgi:hypothetical protein
MENIVKLIRLDFQRAVKGFLSVLPRGITRHYYKTENADFSIFLCWVRDKLHLPLTREHGLKRFVAPKDTTVFLQRKSY